MHRYYAKYKSPKRIYFDEILAVDDEMALELARLPAQVNAGLKLVSLDRVNDIGRTAWRVKL
jgi:hypothetical protein